MAEAPAAQGATTSHSRRLWRGGATQRCGMHRPRGDGRGFVHRLLVKLLARRVRTLALHLQQVPVRQHLPRGTSLAPQLRVRRVNGVGWCWLAVVAAALVGTARGEDPSPGDANEGRGEAPSLLAASELTRVNGAPFVWPALDAAPYAEAGPFGEAVAAWREQGARPARSLPPANSPAALYLAADFAYLAAAAGAGDYLAAVTGYERALREAPDFPDAARGRFMLGQANLLLGFGPEAGAAFADLVRHDPQSPLAGDARLGQAAALRLRRRPTEARRLLDAVLAEASGALLCRARGEEVAEARAAGSPAEAARAYRRLVAVSRAARRAPRHGGRHRGARRPLRGGARAARARRDARARGRGAGGRAARRDPRSLGRRARRRRRCGGRRGRLCGLRHGHRRGRRPRGRARDCARARPARTPPERGAPARARPRAERLATRGRGRARGGDARRGRHGSGSHGRAAAPRGPASRRAAAQGARGCRPRRARHG